MKLTIDERELLEDLLAHEGMKPLFKELESALELFNNRVIQYNLGSSNREEFLLLKAQSDGARMMLESLKQRLKVKAP